MLKGGFCSKVDFTAQKWADMALSLGKTNMEPARGFFGRGRAGPGALNSHGHSEYYVTILSLLYYCGLML